MTRTGFALRNGSRVEILAQSERAVRGTRVHKMRCDEVELFKRDIWEAAQLTTRSLVGMPMEGDASVPAKVVARGSVEVYSTRHEPGGLMSELMGAAGNGEVMGVGGKRIFRWCLWDVMARCHGNRKCETCALWEGCRGKAREGAGFLRVADVLAMKKRVTPKAWDCEMLCFAPYRENQVFEEFEVGVHVRAFPRDGQPAAGEEVDMGEQVLRFETLIAGIDFGWQKFACVWIAMLRDPRGQRVAWVLDEYLAAKQTLSFHARAVRNKSSASGAGTAVALWQPAVVYCDVAGRQHNSHTGTTSEGELRKEGFVVKSRPMEIEDSIGMVKRLLACEVVSAPGAETRTLPRLFVHPRCEALILALQKYVRDKKGRPIKDGEHDHIVDALRYALVGHEGRGMGVEVRRY